MSVTWKPSNGLRKMAVELGRRLAMSFATCTPMGAKGVSEMGITSSLTAA
jgi:hypothetical protein